MTLHLFAGAGFRLAARAGPDGIEALAAEGGDGAAARPGAVFRARVRAFDPALGGAFLDLGEGGEAFLPCPAAAPPRRDPLVVRIAAPARGAKLALARPAPADGAGRGPPGCLRAGMDPARRVSGGRAPAGPAHSWPAGGGAPGDPREAARVLEEVAGLCRAEVLPGAGEARLVIEPTEALVAIDVDGPGGARAGRGEAALRLGLLAAPAIVRQVALRNLAGAIVADFVRPDEARARARVVGALRRGFGPDPRVTRVGRMSPSGLVEIVRAREGPALHEVLGRPEAGGAAPGFGALLAELRLAAAARDGAAGPLEVAAAPGVARLLAADGGLAGRVGREVRVAEDPSADVLDPRTGAAR